MKRTAGTIACRAVAILASALLLAVSAQAAAPVQQKLRAVQNHTTRGKISNANYVIVPIDIPEAIFYGSPFAIQAYDINNSGLVSVYFADPATFTAYMLLADSSRLLNDYLRGVPPALAEFTKIQHSGSEPSGVAKFTSMVATNNGLMFGNWGDMLVQHAAVYDLRTRTWTELPDIAGKPLNFGQRMNEAGLAVGNACEGNYYYSSNCIRWTWDSKRSQYMSFESVPDGYNFSINNRKQTTGGVIDPALGRLVGFFQDRGTVIPLSDVNVTQSIGLDINDSGTIVLALYPDNAPSDFVLWDRGTLTPLPEDTAHPGVIATTYSGLNDRGDLAGTAYQDDGTVRAFIALRK